MTLTTPLALIPDVEQETTHEPFRLIATDRLYTIQARINQEWKSLYKFDLQEQQLPDYEVSNWYVSTHPNSQFVNNLIVAKPDGDRRYALRNNQFSVHYLDGQMERHTLSSVAEIRTTLEDAFAIDLKTVPNVEQTLQQLLDRLE